MICRTKAVLLACPAIIALISCLDCFGAESVPTNAVPGQPVSSKAQLVEPAEAAALIASKKVVVLDVRSAAEYAHGHIAGSTNLDFHGRDFRARLEKLDKNQPYLVHCAVGMRSAQACKVMNQMEFKSLYDLKGGLTAWEKAGEAVEK